MQKYLFLILNGSEINLSKVFQTKTKILDPRMVFMNCMYEFVGGGSDGVRVDYSGVESKISRKGNLTTYEGEEGSFLLIKLEV
jgi:hypothetical protein